MKVSVRGHLWDLLAFRGLVPRRKKRIARTTAQPVGVHAVNALAQELHPEVQHLTIAEVREETATTRSFKLVPSPGSGTGALARFRAGQYLSLKIPVDGVEVTRPYSIASAPYEALGAGGYYQITMKQASDGFVTRHAWDQWQVGTEVRSSGPLGTFYHEPLRDSRRIVGLAGGSGITPFRSMAREIVDGDLDAELLLLYGSSAQDDIPFFDELKELEARAPGRVRVVHVLSCDEAPLEGCEQGFITAEIIHKHADVAGSSFFLCGPLAMYEFLEKELATLGLPRRRVRRELYGAPKDPRSVQGFPAEKAGLAFRLTVQVAGSTVQVPASALETVLVAMERGGLVPPSQCRSGECGFCRSRLVSGEVFVVPDSDGRRAADRRFGYIHPCSSYPMANLELVVERGG